MIDIGVASPSAHGHAIMTTDTAATSALANAGCGPKTIHPTNDKIATAMTAGTNQAETWSASRWIGARLRCASDTIATMRASTVSPPTFSARMTSEPLPFTVPPISCAPVAFSTGTDSPVTIDSSTALRPSSTAPSTGTRPPGFTRSRSPTCTSSSGTSTSPPSSLSRVARGGARPNRARMAVPVPARARNSKTCPSRTSTVMTAAAS